MELWATRVASLPDPVSGLVVSLDDRSYWSKGAGMGHQILQEWLLESCAIKAMQKRNRMLLDGHRRDPEGRLATGLEMPPPNRHCALLADPHRAAFRGAGLGGQRRRLALGTGLS